MIGANVSTLSTNYISTLTPEEIEVLRDYTNWGYIFLAKVFTNRLDNNDIFTFGDDDYERKISQIITILENAPPLDEPIKVFHGTKIHETNNMFDSCGKKKCDVRGLFLSTTSNKDVALTYSKGECCLYEIELQDGVKCLDVSSVSAFEEESEILLPPMSFFECVGERIEYDVHYIDTNLNKPKTKAEVRIISLKTCASGRYSTVMRMNLVENHTLDKILKNLQ